MPPKSLVRANTKTIRIMIWSNSVVLPIKITPHLRSHNQAANDPLRQTVNQGQGCYATTSPTQERIFDCAKLHILGNNANKFIVKSWATPHRVQDPTDQRYLGTIRDQAPQRLSSVAVVAVRSSTQLKGGTFDRTHRN